MSEHTPGPLHVAQDDQWPFAIRICRADSSTVQRIDLPYYSTRQESAAEAMAGRHLNGDDRELAVRLNSEAMANALLWAGSHDLLAALRKAAVMLAGASVHFPGLDAGGQVYEAVSAAIAKATGAET